MPNQQQESEPIKGFTVVRLHYTADEAKDEKWAQEIRRDLPTEDWLREYELVATGRDKEHPVYTDWKRDLHERNLRYDSRHPVIFRGWDFGKVHPACVWIQVSGPEINILHELMGTEVQLEPFALEVIAKSRMWFPQVMKFIDWVDPHGTAEKDDGRASVKVLKECGINVKYQQLGTYEVEDGILLVGKQLIRIVPGGRPALCADPKECPILCDAMRGGYKRNARGKIIADGYYEHLADALRYDIFGIMKAIGGGPDIHIQKALKHQYRPNNQITGY